MNLRGIWTVFHKEFRENLRDRRTLLSALVFGPLISPILVAVLVQFLISRTVTQADQDISLAVIHAENAPNLALTDYTYAGQSKYLAVAREFATGREQMGGR